MSTQSGGQAMADSGVIYDTNNATVQSFFSNPSLGTIIPSSATSIETGVTQYTTSTGEVVTMVGDNYIGLTLKLGNSGSAPIVGSGAASGHNNFGQVVIGTNDNTVVIGSSGGNNVFLTDAAFHEVKGLAGNDFIQNAGNGGGLFFGGAGNDTLIAGGGLTKLDGGAGRDQLVGGADVNKMLGGLGNDTLTAGAGSDVMTGGAGKDAFIFGAHNTSSGGAPYQDHITDFHKGDTLDLSARAGQYQIAQSGKDTVINFSNGDQIVIHNLKASKLHDNDDGIFSI